MVDKYKGIIELDFAGSKIGFKFGIRSMTLFCNAQNITLKDSKEYLEKAAQDQNMEVIISFYHAGAVAYSRLMKKPEPSVDEVFAWVDELGFDFMEAKISEVHKIPNDQAPEITGQVGS